MNSISVDLV